MTRVSVTRKAQARHSPEAPEPPPNDASPEILHGRPTMPARRAPANHHLGGTSRQAKPPVVIRAHGIPGMHQRGWLAGPPREQVEQAAGREAPRRRPAQAPPGRQIQPQGIPEGRIAQHEAHLPPELSHRDEVPAERIAITAAGAKALVVIEELHAEEGNGRHDAAAWSGTHRRSDAAHPRTNGRAPPTVRLPTVPPLPRVGGGKNNPGPPLPRRLPRRFVFRRRGRGVPGLALSRPSPVGPPPPTSWRRTPA